MNRIINVAIHDLRRTPSGFSVVLGNSSLPTTSTSQRVVDELHELYGKRASKSYGKFSADSRNYPTAKLLADYLKAGPPGFPALTSALMDTLRVKAGGRGAATGGHVFFAHSVSNTKHYLLVAIITDKLGAALTRSFDVTDIEHLDMEGFRFAGRINMTGWQKSEERYIGFLRGKGDVAEYFKEFLGCDTTVQARKDTSDLVSALQRFADSKGLSGEDRDGFLQRAKGICDRSAIRREELQFSALANELTPDDPSELLAVLTDPEITLNDGFVPDRRALNTLVRMKARTPLWSIEFEREALTKRKILFDRSANTLTITDIPNDLRDELIDQMPD